MNGKTINPTGPSVVSTPYEHPLAVNPGWYDQIADEERALFAEMDAAQERARRHAEDRDNEQIEARAVALRRADVESEP